MRAFDSIWYGFALNGHAAWSHAERPVDDYREAFKRSEEAIYHAALFVFQVAMREGIDFMSESCYGMEMNSPARFDEDDLPYLRGFAHWTRRRGGLFWYHNCGFTRKMIADGTIDQTALGNLAQVSESPVVLTQDQLAAGQEYLTGNWTITIE